MRIFANQIPLSDNSIGKNRLIKNVLGFAGNYFGFFQSFFFKTLLEVFQRY